MQEAERSNQSIDLSWKTLWLCSNQISDNMAFTAFDHNSWALEGNEGPTKIWEMLSWNEDPKTRTSSKIRTLVLIQETKKGGFCHYLIKSMGSSGDIGWNFVESFGKFGGLIISWEGRACGFRSFKRRLHVNVFDSLQVHEAHLDYNWLWLLQGKKIPLVRIVIPLSLYFWSSVLGRSLKHYALGIKLISGWLNIWSPLNSAMEEEFHFGKLLGWTLLLWVLSPQVY